MVIDLAYRNRGVVRGPLHKLIKIASGKGLEKLMFEVVADTGEAAKGTAQLLGFVPVAVCSQLTSRIIVATPMT